MEKDISLDVSLDLETVDFTEDAFNKLISDVGSPGFGTTKDKICANVDSYLNTSIEDKLPSTGTDVESFVVNLSELENFTVIEKSDQGVIDLCEPSTSAGPTTDPVTHYFKCPDCDLLALSEDLLVKHLETHRPNQRPQKPYKCAVDGCEWSFDFNYRLKRHMLTHTRAKGIPCPECPRTFTTTYNLNVHIKKCHDTDSNTIPCVVPDCEKKFKLQKHLDEHVSCCHPEITKLKCTLSTCKRKFYTQEDLENHVTTHKMNFVCDECGKRFYYESRYTEHMNGHLGKKPHVCPFANCSMAFVSTSLLRRHEKIHTDDRPHSCHYEGCTKSFYRKEHLKTHMDSEHHHRKPFHCPVDNCKSKFASKSGLTWHVNRHNTQGTTTVYNCPFTECSKQCSSEETIKQHIQIHINQGDPKIIHLLESRGDVDEEMIACLKLAESTLVPDRPSTLLPIILSTIQSRLNVENPVTFLLETALLAAEKVKVNGSKPEEEMEEKLSTDILYADVEHGSSRTDYIINHLVSEHARTRLQLMRENGNLTGVVSLQNLVRVRSVAQEELEEESDDEFEMEIDGFNLNDLLRRPDMTLRDPETGVSYDQTQLLQDDPPPL